MRRKIPALVEALTGRFDQHHAFLCRMMLAHVDGLDAAIAEVTSQIEAEIKPFQAVADAVACGTPCSALWTAMNPATATGPSPR